MMSSEHFLIIDHQIAGPSTGKRISKKPTYLREFEEDSETDEILSQLDDDEVRDPDFDVNKTQANTGKLNYKTFFQYCNIVVKSKDQFKHFFQINFQLFQDDEDDDERGGGVEEELRELLAEERENENKENDNEEARIRTLVSNRLPDTELESGK